MLEIKKSSQALSGILERLEAIKSIWWAGINGDHYQDFHEYEFLRPIIGHTIDVVHDWVSLLHDASALRALEDLRKEIKNINIKKSNLKEIFERLGEGTTNDYK